MGSHERSTVDRRRLIQLGGIAGLGALSLAVTGGVLADQGTATPDATPGASPSASPGASPASGTTFTIKMVDLAFQPNALTVPADTEITIELVNDGVLAHDFVVAKLSISSGLVDPGKTKTITATIPAGSYEFICSVEGHADAGMYGTLTAK